MSLSKIKFNATAFLSVLFAILLIVLFYFSFDSSGAFADRSFSIGEPVPEGIIAVHDFSVPYSEAEKNEMILQIDQSLPVYLSCDPEIKDIVSQSIREIILENSGRDELAEYFANKITNLYATGIVDLNQLRELYTGTRAVINGRNTENISELFTLSEAREDMRLYLERNGYPSENIDDVLELIQADLNPNTSMRDAVLQEKERELSNIKISFETGDVILIAGGLFTEEISSYWTAMAISSQRTEGTINHNIGKTGLAGLLILLGVFYIWKEQKIGNPSISLMFLFFVVWAISIILTAFLARLKIPELSIFSFTLFGSTLTSIFFDKEDRRKTTNITWFFAAIFSAVFSLVSPYPMATFFLAFIPSCLTATLIRNLSDNDVSKTILTGVISSFLVYWMLILSGSIGAIGFNTTVVLSLIGIPLVTLGTVRVLIHPLETLFGVATALTYKRLGYDTNVLRERLRTEAPGTARHSKLVSELSQKLAAALGADETLAKLGGYFHDIGKLTEPLLFAENMDDPDNNNPHDNLPPVESAKIIQNHVSDGILLAKKEKLPKDIIAIIRQHHGDTAVSAFLEKAKLELPPGTELNEIDFHYDQPKPQSIEAALVMITDSVSSAVIGKRRKLNRELTNTEISSLITNIIGEKKLQGQFAESGLTEIMFRKIAHELFNELTIVDKRLKDFPHGK